MDEFKPISNFGIWIKYLFVIGLIIFTLSIVTWYSYGIKPYQHLRRSWNCTQTPACDVENSETRREISREIAIASVVNRFQGFFDVVHGKLKKFETEIRKLNITDYRQVEHARSDIVQLRNNIWSESVFKNYTHYRQKELSKLTKKIQKRIFNLQHPADCKNAKKIFCNNNVPNCGFGCQMHSVSYCLIVAYSKKRVMLPVFTNSWSYSAKGWNEFFQPLTNCTINDKPDNGHETTDLSSIDTLNVPFYNYPMPTLPPAFPKEFAEDLASMHPNPPVYWIGQFMAYIMRYQPSLQKHIDDKMEAYNFTRPIVGIQVRRTDKGGEADFWSIEKYMEHVSAWYDMNTVGNSTENETRLVYLATDEPSVLNETHNKFPNYRFLFNHESAMKAKIRRYSDSSLLDIVTSLHILSNCDFVVCTFSSNLCRFVYELKSITNIHPNNVISLDLIYYYYGQHRDHHIAVLEHRPDISETDEIELNVGDIVEVKIPTISKHGNKNNEFDGRIIGRNLRTNKMGKYPIYKVKEKWRLEDFPKYP